ILGSRARRADGIPARGPLLRHPPTGADGAGIGERMGRRQMPVGGPVGPGLGAGRGRLLGDGRRRRKRGSRGATAMTFNLYDTFHATARRLEGDVQVERSEEHTSELQSRSDLVCRLLLEKKKTTKI